MLAAAAAALALLASPQVRAQNASTPADQTTTPANGGNQLQQVIVTAQFVRQSAQTTPLAITAISGAQLANRGQTSLTQVAADAPSVNLVQDEGAFGPAMGAFIRGIGQFDLDPALEPGVGIYIDNVYFGTITGSLLDLLDLQRVEILRGPQGTLEGMNSEGGAIKLFSKPPNSTPELSFDALYGSRNHVEVRGTANFALVPHKLFIRLAGVGNHQDGYVNVYDFGCSNPSFTATDSNGVTGTFSVAPEFVQFAHKCLLHQEGGTGYSAGRIYLRWVINDQATNDIIGDITNQNQEGPATTLLFAGPGPGGCAPGAPACVENITIPATNTATGQPALLPYDSSKVPAMIPANRYASYASFCMPAINNPISIPPLGSNANEPAYCSPDRQILESWGVSDTLNWTLTNKWSLENIVSQRGYFSSWYEDNDVSPWPVGLGGDSLEHHQTSEELRFTGSVGSLVGITFGGFYFRENSIYASHQDLSYALSGVVIPGYGPLLGFLNFIQDDPVLAHDKAGYLHTVWHLTHKLNVTLGVRYTSQDKTYHYTRVNPQGGTGGSATLVGPLNGVVGVYSANRWDYRADIDYRFTPSVMTYAQVSTGFKGGGVDPRPFYVAQAIHFNPETLTNYELGLKSQWFDNHLRLNIDGYFSQYRDIQETLLNCSGVPAIAAASAAAGFNFGSPCALPYNAGTAHEKGVEFETQGRWGGFEFNGSMSYLDFEYVGLFGLDPATGFSPVSGLSLGMVSPFTSKWQGSLGLQYTFPIGNVGALTWRVEGRTRSGFYTNAVNASTNHVGGRTTYNTRLTYQPDEGNWQIAAQVMNLTDKFYYTNVFDLTSVGGGSIAGTPAPPLEADLEIKYTLH